MKNERTTAVIAGLLCMAAIYASPSWGTVGFSPGQSLDAKEFLLEARASAAPVVPKGLATGSSPEAGVAAKLKALTALMARTREDLADIKNCGDFRLGSGGVYGSGLFNRGGIWCSVEHECPRGTCHTQHQLVSPEQLEASPFAVVSQELVYLPGTRGDADTTMAPESAIVKYDDLKTAFKRVLEQAAKPRACQTRTIQITGGALRQGRAFRALEEHGCEIEVKSCSLGGLAGSAILLQIRQASAEGKPRRTEALLGSLEFARRVSELERLGYTVDTVCYAHHFSGTQAVIQYSKR